MTDSLIIEPLSPKLAPYLMSGEPFPCLKHPLVFVLPYTPHMNEHANRLLEQKERALAIAIANRDLHRICFLHERPYRIEAFMSHSQQVDDETYWRELGCIYVDSENIDQYWPVWRAALLSKRSSRHMMMDDDDRAHFDALPDEITIYRGSAPGVFKDASWSLCPDVAKWFSQRFDRDGKNVIYEGVVDKKNVLAYLNIRSEQEILVMREHVKIKQVMKQQKVLSRSPGV